MEIKFWFYLVGFWKCFPDISQSHPRMILKLVCIEWFWSKRIETAVKNHGNPFGELLSSRLHVLSVWTMKGFITFIPQEAVCSGQFQIRHIVSSDPPFPYLSITCSKNVSLVTRVWKSDIFTCLVAYTQMEISHLVSIVVSYQPRAQSPLVPVLRIGWDRAALNASEIEIVRGGWPSRLITRFCWHKIWSCILVYTGLG